MTQSMWDCRINGWLGMALKSGASFLLFLVLLLAAPALSQHVLLASRKV